MSSLTELHVTLEAQAEKIVNDFHEARWAYGEKLTGLRESIAAALTWERQAEQKRLLRRVRELGDRHPDWAVYQVADTLEAEL